MSAHHRCANPAAAPAPKLGASASASSSHSALGVEQTQLAVTGTRKAKVLYDYDAHDASELSLLADEVQSPGRVWRAPSFQPSAPTISLGFCLFYFILFFFVQSDFSFWALPWQPNPDQCLSSIRGGAVSLPNQTLA